MEKGIPLPALGDPNPCIKIAVMVNGGGHDFLSNQVLGSLLPNQCNLGEPSTESFRRRIVLPLSASPCETDDIIFLRGNSGFVVGD